MDMKEAREWMRSFSECAYHIKKKDKYEKAIQVLYGLAFTITLDFKQRMRFSCSVCNKSMNCENAMSEHSNSGTHQKNVDTYNMETRKVMPIANVSAAGSSIASTSSLKTYKYGSLQAMLNESVFKAIGLQMVEEYTSSKIKSSYYICNLCGAHGRKEAIYRHLIGPKHTEKYISIRVSLPLAVLDPGKREEYRQIVIQNEGQGIDDIGFIKGSRYYPHKLISNAASRESVRVKKEKGLISESHKMKDDDEIRTGVWGTGANAIPIQTPLNLGLSSAEKYCKSAAIQTDNKQEGLESIMSKVNLIIQTSDLPGMEIKTQEDYAISLNIVHHLCIAMFQEADVSSRNGGTKFKNEKMNSKYMMSKMLGRLQKNLIPSDPLALEYLRKHSGNNADG